MVRRATWVACSLLLTLLGGCTPRLVAKTGPAETPGIARVELTRQRGETFDLFVHNLSSSALEVDGEAFVLVARAGSRQPRPGPATSVYTLQPGESRTIQLQFSLAGIRFGEEAQLVFPRALRLHGQPVPVMPIPLRTE